MPDLDLAVRLRDYAREQETALVSSAWLAEHFGVDPRTIAAALRPFGVRPGEVEAGVRGYSVAELAGIVLPGDEEYQGIALLDQPVEPSPPAAVEEWAAEAVRWAEDAVILNRADLPEQVDGGWRCGRCKTPMTGTGRCLDCWPASEAPDVLADRIPTEASAMPDGWPGPGWHDLVDDPEADAIARLSAGAGHDMTPALRAAGLL